MDESITVILGYYDLYETELNLFRGLGKRALCRGIHEIIEHFDINPERSIVVLYACGGQIMSSDVERVENYDNDAVVNIYKNKYPNDYGNFEDLDSLTNYEI